MPEENRGPWSKKFENRWSILHDCRRLPPLPEVTPITQQHNFLLRLQAESGLETTTQTCALDTYTYTVTVKIDNQQVCLCKHIAHDE